MPICNKKSCQRHILCHISYICRILCKTVKSESDRRELQFRSLPVFTRMLQIRSRDKHFCEMAWTHTYFCFPSSRITNVATTPGFLKMWDLGNKLRFSASKAGHFPLLPRNSLTCFSTWEHIYSLGNLNSIFIIYVIIFTFWNRKQLFS